MSFWAQLSSNDTLFAEPQQQLSKITELDESQQDSNNIMSQQDSNNIMNQFLNIPMDFSFANQFGDNGANLKHELAYSRSLCEVASSLSNGVVFPNHSDAELSKEKSNFSSIALITPTEMSLPNMPISAASYQKQQERFAAAYNKPATEVKSEPSSLPSINGLGGMRSEKPSSGHSSHLDVEKFVQDMKLSFNDFDHVGGWKQHDQNAAYVQPLNTFAHSVLPSPPEKTPTSPDFVSMNMANNFNFRSPISNPMQKQMNHDAMVSLLFTNPQQQQQQQHNQLRINTFQEQSSMPSRPAGDVSYPPSSFNNNRRYPGSFSGSFQDSNGSLRINTRQTSMGSLPSSGAPSSRSSFPSSHSEVSFFSDRFPFDQQAALTSASAIAAANARKIRRGPSKSSKSPAGPYNMDEIPREQRLKSANDMYTPRWVRYQGAAKEGLCDICKPGKWLQLKNSAFWYHKQFVHGISSVTSTEFAKPTETRLVWTTEMVANRYCVYLATEGHCHACKGWVTLAKNRKRHSQTFDSPEEVLAIFQGMNIVSMEPIKAIAVTEADGTLVVPPCMKVTQSMVQDLINEPLGSTWFRHAFKCHAAASPSMTISPAE